MNARIDTLIDETNPLLQDWATPYQLPPFDAVLPEHFAPAFGVAMSEHLVELEAIAANPEAASFENTAVAFDRSGRRLKRISLLFHNLTASETSPLLQQVERELAPRQAAHRNAVFLNAALFARMDRLHLQLQVLDLDGEERRLVERFHRDFVRAGANLQGDRRQRFGQLSETLATLCTEFSQNVLADEAEFVLPLENEDDLAGLPMSLLDATEEAARASGLSAGSRVVTLSPSVVDPFLTFSSRRDLREKIWHARASRGAHTGPHDNRPVASRILSLRQEKAALLGYATYAEYAVSDRMAATPQAAQALLESTWRPALSKAAADRDALTAAASKLGQPTPIAAWDWQYLAEKVRKTSYDLDDAEVKAYFTLESMIAAAFDCATRLFGVQFTERTGVDLHHRDARLWEVTDGAGVLTGIFIGDYFARPTKRSGAWMSVFRSQSGIDGGTVPIVINNNNFAKGNPTLLSFDDVRTLFHEFGHGLHGLLSNVAYERLAGTNVPGDFVEFPSQIFENWAEDVAILRQHARHYETGAPIPDALLMRLAASRQFNQAFGTIQYVAPALIDMALHAQPAGTQTDIAAFEAAQCQHLGVPADIGMRHHLSHFQHLFGGEGYAAGYYVYMWADVLAADGFAAFEEAGDAFDTATAHRLHRYVYSSGGTMDFTAAYRAFRGRDPDVTPMLVQRGLGPDGEAQVLS